MVFVCLAIFSSFSVQVLQAGTQLTCHSADCCYRGSSMLGRRYQLWRAAFAAISTCTMSAGGKLIGSQAVGLSASVITGSSVS